MSCCRIAGSRKPDLGTLDCTRSQYGFTARLRASYKPKLKRAIYTGRISPAQAKRPDEMRAVADDLSLLASTVMAWNAMQTQAVVNRRANRRQVIEVDIMAKIAPTRLSGINLRRI